MWPVALDAAGLGTILPMLWTSLFGGRKAILATTYTRSAEANVADLETLKTLFEQGSFRAVIDRRYPLDDLASAYRYVDTGRKRGNLVINPP